MSQSNLRLVCTQTFSLLLLLKSRNETPARTIVAVLALAPWAQRKLQREKIITLYGNKSADCLVSLMWGESRFVICLWSCNNINFLLKESKDESWTAKNTHSRTKKERARWMIDFKYNFEGIFYPNKTSFKPDLRAMYTSDEVSSIMQSNDRWKL